MQKEPASVLLRNILPGSWNTGCKKHEELWVNFSEAWLLIVKTKGEHLPKGFPIHWESWEHSLAAELLICISHHCIFIRYSSASHSLSGVQPSVFLVG